MRYAQLWNYTLIRYLFSQSSIDKQTRTNKHENKQINKPANHQNRQINKTNKQTNKQTNTKTSKQTSKPANRQTSKLSNKRSNKQGNSLVTFQQCCYKLVRIDALRVQCIRQYLERKQTNIKKKQKKKLICNDISSGTQDSLKTYWNKNALWLKIY